MKAMLSRAHEQSTRDQQMIAADFKFTLDNEIVEQKVSRAVEQITRQSMIQDSNQVDLNYHYQNSTVGDIAINNKEQVQDKHIFVR